MDLNTKFLDGTRFVLALWVVAGHFYALIGANVHYTIPLFGDVLLSNGTAVDGFMVITGFLMTYQYLLRKEKEHYTDKSTFFKFWLRRLFRLYPVYLISVIVAFLLVKSKSSMEILITKFFTGGTLSPWGFERIVETSNFFDLLSHLTFLHGLIPSNVTSILSPAWSLSLEMQFYFLFPFIFLLFFSNRKVIINRVVLLLGFSVVLSVLFPKVFGSYLTEGIMMHFGLPSIIFYKLPLFLLGMVLASVALNKISVNYLLFSLLFIMPFQVRITNLVIIFLVTFLFLDYFKDILNGKLLKVLLFIRNLLSNKVSQFGANISYSLYLTHMIILPIVVREIISISVLADNFSKSQIAIISGVVFLIINILICHMIYLFIEKPFISMGKRVTQKIN